MGFWSKKLTFRENPGATEAINQQQVAIDQAEDFNPMAKGTKRLLRDLMQGRADQTGIVKHIAGTGAKLNAAYKSNRSFNPELPPDVQARIDERRMNENNTAAAQMAVDSASDTTRQLISMREQGRQFKQAGVQNARAILAQLMANRYQGAMEGGEGMGLLGALIQGGATAAGGYLSGVGKAGG